MKTTTLLILTLASFCLVSYGQQFNENIVLELSDSLTYHDVMWMDADNDSLVDVLVAAKDVHGELIVLVMKNDLQNGFRFAGHLNTHFTNTSWHLTDFDGDNRVDIVISGHNGGKPQTTAFLNMGNFIFQPQIVVNMAADLIRFADLNSDGYREMILSGEDTGRPFLRIFRQGAAGWFVAHDSVAIQARGIEVLNFDSDHDQDFFVSGIDESGDAVTVAFFNQGGFYFKIEDFTPGIVGRTGQADLKHDGAFDIVVYGKDAGGSEHLMTFNNTQSGFHVTDSLVAVTGTEFFLGDFNSDGLNDIHLMGLVATGDTVNAIFGSTGIEPLLHAHVVTQAIGDYDRDGDLDILQLRRSSTGVSIAILENTELKKNKYPPAPYDVVIANIFDRLFICWENPKDDRTPSSSLTYDVTIRSSSENLMTGEFDLIHSSRLLVSHGNNGTNEHILLRTGHAGPYYFNIQAVDNAFHAGWGGTCEGSGGGNRDDCVEIEDVSIEACRREVLTLTSDTVARWFSFREGFLGKSSQLDFEVLQADTVFSVVSPSGSACALVKVFTIDTPLRVTKVVDHSVNVCEGEALRLGVEPHWQDVAWSSTSKGFLSNEDSVDYVVLLADTIKASVSDGPGCEIQRNFFLKVSKPVLDIGPEAYQILKGESVPLHVSGGERYRWSPPSGLTDPLSSNPIASPVNTTEYVVTARDSVGCEATARVLVIVEETAFIPNLFTPNYDGNNDDLRIYGLGQANNFTFAIYNREGSRVYHTSDVSEAVNGGWNGMSGGIEQPAGVYYWNVRGETGSGKALRLNGKTSGSIVLVR